MAVLLKNNASSRLASAINSTATTLSVTSGTGGRFPVVSANDWFPVTVVKDDGSLEVMRCTGRNGDVLTVVRAQEGTAALAFDVNARVELRVTAAAMDQFAQTGKANAWVTTQTYGAEVQMPGGLRLPASGSVLNDAPDIVWTTNKWELHSDLSADLWRLYHAPAGTTNWTVGLTYSLTDFKLRTASGEVPVIAADGVMEIGHHIDMHNTLGVDDYNLRLSIGADGNLWVATTGAAKTGRVWTSYDLDDVGKVPRRAAAVDTTGMYLRASNVPAMGAMDAPHYDQVALTIENGGNTAAAALMQFHRATQFATFFGIDTDNQLKIGGRSMGGAYPIWHDGMDWGSRVMTLVGNQPVGGVGTYALMMVGGGGGVNPGDLVAGANLRYCAAGWIANTPPAATGTWRLMGQVFDADGAGTNSITLCMRVA